MTTNIVIDVNPKYLGKNSSEHHVESFAFDIKKNVEKAFNIKCDYTTIYNNKNYQIVTPDPLLQISISEFIETNWNHIFCI